MNSLNQSIKNIWQSAALPKFLFFFLAIWTAVVLFGGIPFGDLSGYDDCAYTHEARNVIQTGDWWTLYLNGNLDFDKPPLFIWMLAASFKIFGTTDFAAKIPGALLGWATVLLVYFLARELFSDELEESPKRKWIPALSMLCMATTQYFLKYASHAMTDVPFTFFFTLAIYFYARASKNKFSLLASGLAIGLAMMVRSPMGLFPLGIIAFHLIFTRRLKLLFSFYFFGCVVLALAVPATWYLQEYHLYGDAFITAHFTNFLAHSESVITRTAWQQFLWYFEYIFLIVKLYLPWFPLMFYGIFLSARRIRQQSAPIELLLIIWIGVVLLPFSLADSKVLRYILPAFPAFAIFSAYALFSLLTPKRLPKLSQWAFLLLALTGIVTNVFHNYETRAEDMRIIAPFSDAASKPGEKVVLYTSGEYQWNYRNQLLWYGHRLCNHLKDLKEVKDSLSENKKTVVVMDKASFAELTKQFEIKPVILGESKSFICFRVDS